MKSMRFKLLFMVILFCGSLMVSNTAYGENPFFSNKILLSTTITSVQHYSTLNPDREAERKSLLSDLKQTKKLIEADLEELKANLANAKNFKAKNGIKSRITRLNSLNKELTLEINKIEQYKYKQWSKAKVRTEAKLNNIKDILKVMDEIESSL